MEVKTPAGPLTIGAMYDLTLRHGENERPMRAKIVAFEHVERIYDDEMIAVDRTVETRYRAESEDEVVGFLPEHVLSAELA